MSLSQSFSSAAKAVPAATADKAALSHCGLRIASNIESMSDADLRTYKARNPDASKGIITFDVDPANAGEPMLSRIGTMFQREGSAEYILSVPENQARDLAHGTNFDNPATRERESFLRQARAFLGEDGLEAMRTGVNEFDRALENRPGAKPRFGINA